MIPKHNLAIPDVLHVIRSRIGDGDMTLGILSQEDAAEQSLLKAILNRTLLLRVMVGGVPTTVPRSDLAELVADYPIWFHGGRVANQSKYNGCQPFMHAFEVDCWLGSAPEQESRSGLPGYPSVMHVALAEHRRRVKDEVHAGSRTAEAKDLEAWHKKAHPNGRHPTAKTILNNLPSDFQPYNAALPKQ